ncbi:MAG: hypothetical protein HA492_04845 [Candidatus Verstraetearchaeota archaeon]|nr:hypothetical protein [Candidatus Verstraetearchaeota archaeon]
MKQEPGVPEKEKRFRKTLPEQSYDCVAEMEGKAEAPIRQGGEEVTLSPFTAEVIRFNKSISLMPKIR